MKVFDTGDIVYLTGGHLIERYTIARVTRTHAIIRLSHGPELRFARSTGMPVKKTTIPTFGTQTRIEHASPELDRRFRISQRRALAGQLSHAAQQYERGDEKQEGRVRELYAQWVAFAEPSDDD